MALLDKYYKKGRVFVISLTPAEREEMRELVQSAATVQEQRQLGFIPLKTGAHLDERAILREGSASYVGFEVIEPEKEPTIIEGAKTPFVRTMSHFRGKLTKEQREESIERYGKELEEAGIVLHRPEKKEASETDQGANIRRVLSGIRKVALVDEYNAGQARQWGLVAFKVPHGSFAESSVARKKAYVIYRPGNAQEAKQVLTILQKYPVGKRGPDYLAEMGAALGTPPAVTNEFIKNYYGESSKKPIWLGLIGAVALVFFLSRKQR